MKSILRGGEAQGLILEGCDETLAAAVEELARRQKHRKI